MAVAIGMPSCFSTSSACCLTVGLTRRLSVVSLFSNLRITQPPDKLNKIPCINGKIASFSVSCNKIGGNTRFTKAITIDWMIAEPMTQMWLKHK